MIQRDPVWSWVLSLQWRKDKSFKQQQYLFERLSLTQDTIRYLCCNKSLGNLHMHCIVRCIKQMCHNFFLFFESLLSLPGGGASLLTGSLLTGCLLAACLLATCLLPCSATSTLGSRRGGLIDGPISKQSMSRWPQEVIGFLARCHHCILPPGEVSQVPPSTDCHHWTFQQSEVEAKPASERAD